MTCPNKRESGPSCQLGDEHAGMCWYGFAGEMSLLLTARRQELGWSRRRAARAAGVSETTIRRWEAPGANLTERTARRYAAALGAELVAHVVDRRQQALPFSVPF